MAGLQRAALVAARHQHQGAVEWKHLVEEHRNVHRARLGHAVVARPGAVVLVPLPCVALERRLGVELELMDVEAFAEQLLQRRDQARVMRQKPEHLVELVRGECGARRAAFLAPYFRAVELEDRVALRAHQRDLVIGEAVGEKQIAKLVELTELLGGQFHGMPPAGRLMRLSKTGRIVAQSFRCSAPILRYRAAAGTGAAKLPLARRSTSASTTSIAMTPSGIRVACAKVRAISGTSQRNASADFSHGAKPRAMPSTVRNAIAGASTIRS